MKNYAVGIKVYNTFYVEAESEEEAEEKVRELSIESTLRDSDFNITYVDEYKAGEECWQIKADELKDLK